MLHHVKEAPRAGNPPTPATHHPENRRRVSWCFTRLWQVEVSCYEASPDTLCGSFPAGCGPTRGVECCESHAARPAPQGPAHSSRCCPGFVLAPSNSNPKGEAPLLCSDVGQGDVRAACRDNCLLSRPSAWMGVRSCFLLPGCELPAVRLFFGQNRTDYMAQLTPAP